MFREYLPGLDSPASERSCACTTSFETSAVTDGPVTLSVDADDCPADGDLVSAAACRATVVGALTERDADLVRTTSDGRTRTYAGRAAALLLAAGRFAERATVHDEPLADRARRDPLGAARDAAGRAGPVARIAAETGLALCATDSDGYDDALPASVAPAVALGRVVPESSPTAPTDRWALDDGTVARRYERADGYDRLHITPASATLDPDAHRALVAARARLATGEIEGGDRAPWRAVAATATDRSLPVERLARILHRHTRGCGFLTNLLAVPGVTDLSLTAPVAETPVRAEWRGTRLETNVRFSRGDAETLASRVRAESGKGLSRADPTADATLDGVRVAAATDPASDGPAFAFRQHRDDSAWTLARLVSAGTLPPRAAALAQLAVERGGAGLIAGPRGSGKTTVLGALLWEIPRTNRVVVVEDTPELPVDQLLSHDRDVQRFTVGSGPDATFSPTDAVRTALRFGDGTLVVGEVRGEEAAALYEAMRVGAASDTVLGTIHGTDGETVQERVVSDLGVPASAFAATDFVLTLDADHCLARIEEVYARDEGGEGGESGGRSDDAPVRFESVFDRDGATGLLDRGNSRLLATLTDQSESYADLSSRLDQRARRLRRLAQSGRTEPDSGRVGETGAGRVVDCGDDENSRDGDDSR